MDMTCWGKEYTSRLLENKAKLSKVSFRQSHMFLFMFKQLLLSFEKISSKLANHITVFQKA